MARRHQLGWFHASARLISPDVTCPHLDKRPGHLAAMRARNACTVRGMKSLPMRPLSEHAVHADAFSPVIGTHGVFLPVLTEEHVVLAIPIMMRNSRDVDLLPIRASSWDRTTQQSRAEIEARFPQPAAELVWRMGKLVELSKDEPYGWLDTRVARPERLGTLRASLASILSVPLSDVGITGSMLYGPPSSRPGDIDVAIYGHQSSELAQVALANERQHSSRATEQPHKIWLDRIKIWLDPFYYRNDPVLERALSAASHHSVETEAVTLGIADDRRGSYFPAVYQCSDGSTLVSFRLGHRSLFNVSDVVSGVIPEPCVVEGRAWRFLADHQHLEIFQEKGRES